MLHILAVIGIVALIVIAVIVAFVLLLLFFPFKYKVKAIVNYGKEEEEESESLKKLDVKAVIYWLFHFLRIELRLDKSDFKYKVRLFGIVIISTEKSEKKKLKKREKERKEYQKKKAVREAEEAKMAKVEDAEKAEDKDAETSEKSTVEPEDKCDETSKSTIDKLKEAHKKDEDKSDKAEKVEKDEEKEEKSGFFAKIKSVFAGLKKVFTFLRDEQNKKTLKLVKDQMIKAIKEVRPGKFKGYIAYGTGDPALTGKLLGVIAVAFGVVGRSMSVVPDFERKKFDGDFFVKGRFRIAVLLGIFLKLYRDKNIKKLLKSAFSK